MRNIISAAILLSLSSTSLGAPPDRISWRWDPQSIGLSCALVQEFDTSMSPVTVGQSVGGGDPGSFVDLKVRSRRLSRNIYEGGVIVLAGASRRKRALSLPATRRAGRSPRLMSRLPGSSFNKPELDS